MRDILPPEGRAQHVQLYKYYKPLEDKGRLTSSLEREWSEKALALHVKYGSKISDLERNAAKTSVRRYTPQAFAVCERVDVPAVILSAGVQNVIAVTTARHDMNPAAILGVELTTQNGTISGWVRDSLVDAQTKREMGHPHIIKVRAHRPNAVLFGDQPQDAGMASGPALRIRINCKTTPSAPEWEGYLDESWQSGYDGIIVDEDLKAAVQLTRWLVGS
jgi:phosphoserine phosphatase